MNEVDRHCERGLIPDVNGEGSPGLSSCDRVLVAIRKSSVPVRILPACFSGRIQKIGKPRASSIMAVPSLDSAGAALDGRRWAGSTRAL